MVRFFVYRKRYAQINQNANAMQMQKRKTKGKLQELGKLERNLKEPWRTIEGKIKEHE